MRPLALRVLPITLQKDPSLVYGQYYHHPFRNLDNAPDDDEPSFTEITFDVKH